MTPQAAALQRLALRRLFRTLFFRGRAGRRPRGGMAPRSIGAALWISLLLYGGMGLMAFTFPVTGVLPYAASMHGVTFFLLSMYVSASAGEALFHKDEADILLHRPVLPQAVLWAKVRVLLEITWWLAGAYNLAGLWFGCTRVTGGGVMFVVSHVLSVGLEALFCVSGIVMAYELCLRWFGRERLDTLMTTVQVLLSMGGVAVWTLMPHAYDATQGPSIDVHAWWTYLLPPFWFAAMDDALTGGGTPATWLTAAAGVAVTATVATLAFGKLAASYGEGLLTLNENVAAASVMQRERRWLDRMVDAPPLRWWLRNPQTRAAFLLTTAYLMRDREVKLRIYPQLASVFALSIAIKLKDTGGPGLGTCACLLAVVPINALESLRYSQQWQAADMFRCAPMTGPGPLCDGARRAVLVCLVLPAVLMLAAMAGITRGARAEGWTAVACLALIPLYARIPSWNGRAIPLATPNEDMRPRRGLLYVGVFLLSGTIMVGATMAEATGWLSHFLGVELTVVGGLYMVARRRLARTIWASVDEV